MISRSDLQIYEKLGLLKVLPAISLEDFFIINESRRYFLLRRHKTIPFLAEYSRCMNLKYLHKNLFLNIEIECNCTFFLFDYFINFFKILLEKISPAEPF